MDSDVHLGAGARADCTYQTPDGNGRRRRDLRRPAHPSSLGNDENLIISSCAEGADQRPRCCWAPVPRVNVVMPATVSDANELSNPAGAIDDYASPGGGGGRDPPLQVVDHLRGGAGPPPPGGGSSPGGGLDPPPQVMRWAQLAPPTCERAPPAHTETTVAV